MAERRVAQIMGEGNGFYQIFIEAQAARNGSRDLCDFEAVGEARAKEVPLVIDEYLCLVFKATKRCRMNDTVSVTLKFSPSIWGGFFHAPST